MPRPGFKRHTMTGLESIALKRKRGEDLRWLDTWTKYYEQVRTWELTGWVKHQHVIPPDVGRLKRNNYYVLIGSYVRENGDLVTDFYRSEHHELFTGTEAEMLAYVDDWYNTHQDVPYPYRDMARKLKEDQHDDQEAPG